jgi:pimeloyl-ACP methyl ester carboxylesterase
VFLEDHLCLEAEAARDEEERRAVDEGPVKIVGYETELRSRRHQGGKIRFDHLVFGAAGGAHVRSGPDRGGNRFNAGGRIWSVERLPVVFVHGILGQEVFYWRILRRRLARLGFSTHEATLPGLGMGDLVQAAHVLKPRVEGIAAACPAGQVDLVAHSAGGLVSRWYLKHLGGTRHVRRLITLGTPHSGTEAARLVPGRGLLGQVRTKSAFLAALDGVDPTPAPTLYSAVWTPYDGVVIPAESARLPPAPNVENILYRGISHWGYLFGPRLAQTLAAELDVGFLGGDREVAAAAYALPLSRRVM